MSLTKSQEKDIVVRFNNGERNKTALAAEFGVSPRTIGRVLERASVKKTKALEIVKGFKAPAFVVGDIVTGNEGVEEEYYITTQDASMEVVKVLDSRYIDVKILAHELMPREVGKTYTVDSKYFVKVGHKSVDTEETVEAPVAKPVNAKEEATYIVSDMAITLMFNGNMQLIDSTHPYFKEVKAAIESGEFSKAAEMMDIKKAIESFSEGLLKIQCGKVLFRGVEVRNELTSKIVALMSQGNEGFKGFAKFMAKVMDNPSSSTRERLMQFAAAEDIGITTEGLLICYKNVKGDFRPSRAGKWELVDGEWSYDSTKYHDNSVGSVCEMPRSEVDDRDEQTCSKGLHVMSLHYAKSFWGTSGHTMVVHVDPVDFVSIPTDYNNSKARVCKYTVVSELTKKELDALLAKV